MTRILLFTLTTLVAFLLAYIFTMPRDGLPPIERSRTNIETPAEPAREQAEPVSPEVPGRVVVPEKQEPASGGDAAQQEPNSDADQSLEPMESREPMSGRAQPQPPSRPEPGAVVIDEKEEFRLLSRPVAVAAGVVEVSGFTIVLEGIDVVPADETCATPDGQSWPCGMQARTAFRSWLRSRSLNCRVPEDNKEKTVVTSCQLAGRDVSEWLVENGWARAKAESANVAKQKLAEGERRGIFGSPTAPLTGGGLSEMPPLDPAIYDPPASAIEPMQQETMREAPDTSLPFPPAPPPD